MKKEWGVKLGVPILTLALLTSCSTTNNKDDMPQDNNTPENENMDYNDTHHNNNDKSVPNKDEKDYRNEDPNINNEGDKRYDDTNNNTR